MLPDLEGGETRAGAKMSQVTVGYRVMGNVQGVGFRYWALREAHALGLGGFVRNASDGSVEIRLAGPVERVGEMEKRVRRGPPGARVTSVEPIAPHSDPLPELFEIRR